MSEEIELKFFVDSEHSEDAVASLIEQTLSKFSLQRKAKKPLKNAYFDTPDLKLRSLDIGLRLRSAGDSFEETAKCKGVVIGGLHKRVEYNIPLESENLDLSKFPTVMWGTEDVEELQKNVVKLFSTDFSRTKWLVMREDAVLAEVCYDKGDVIAGNSTDPISEIEIELMEGTIGDLFAIADELVGCSDFKLHLDSRSKAQRGYELAGLSPKPRARSFERHEGTESDKTLRYAADFRLHEQILLSNFDLRSLSVMTLCAYELQKLTRDQAYGDIIAKLLEMEKMEDDEPGRWVKYKSMISSKIYLKHSLQTCRAALEASISS